MTTRDTQRSKVYAWEQRALPSAPAITGDEALRLVDAVRRAYGLTAIRIQWGGLRSYLGRARYSSIQLRHGVGRSVVLHEMAHVILAQKCHGLAAHGPEFVRVFLDLLSRYMGISPGHAGIRAALRSKVPQPVRAVRERALKPKRKKCPKHHWQFLTPLKTTVTTKGLLVLHSARCRTCNKQLPKAA